MTSTLSVNITSNDNGNSNSPWAHIEQKLIDNSQYANLYDIMRMATMAQSGLTAHLYNQDCAGMSVDADTIAIPLKVYVWPYPLDLNYTIKGVDAQDEEVDLIVSQKRAVSVGKERSVVVGLENKISFEHIIKNVSLIWETPCYDKLGNAVPRPSWIVIKNEIVFAAEIFASVRLSYTAIGFEHTITLLWKNNQQAIEDIKSKIEMQKEQVTVNSAFGSYTVDSTEEQDTRVHINIASLTLIVSYIGGDDEVDDLKEESLAVTIPESVLNCLSQCPDGSLKNGGFTHISQGTPDDETEEWTDVYYSACDGSILDTNTRKVIKSSEETE